jgi:hypothetical protein
MSKRALIVFGRSRFIQSSTLWPPWCDDLARHAAKERGGVIGSRQRSAVILQRDEIGCRAVGLGHTVSRLRSGLRERGVNRGNVGGVGHARHDAETFRKHNVALLLVAITKKAR